MLIWNNLTSPSLVNDIISACESREERSDRSTANCRSTFQEKVECRLGFVHIIPAINAVLFLFPHYLIRFSYLPITTKKNEQQQKCVRSCVPTKIIK